MLDEFVGSAVVIVSFVLNVEADIVEGLLDIQVQVEQLLDDRLVYLVVFAIHLLLGDEVQVIRQVRLVPWVLLDLLKGNALHRIWLQHSVY